MPMARMALSAPSCVWLCLAVVAVISLRDAPLRADAACSAEMMKLLYSVPCTGSKGANLDHRDIDGMNLPIFGLLTVVSGGRALFGGADMGAVVPFVLWFNFAAGFAYVLAGIGLWRGAGWAPLLSLGIAVATAAVFVAFLRHVASGGAWRRAPWAR